MKKEVKEKKCSECGEMFRPKYSTTQKYCSYKCTKKNTKVKTNNNKPFKPKPRKKIKPISENKKKETAVYLKKRIDFLNKSENKYCPVTGKPTTEVHHKAGRIGFYDNWARENGISLLIDERFFLAVSREGHKQIEENPIWAKEQGYSLSRLSNEG